MFRIRQLGNHLGAEIEGVDIASGLEELLEWSTQPQFFYSHRWRRNDLVMWDNRHCLHRVRPFDSGKYKRIMHRTTLAGDGPAVGEDC